MDLAFTFPRVYRRKTSPTVAKSSQPQSQQIDGQADKSESAKADTALTDAERQSVIERACAAYDCACVRGDVDAANYLIEFTKRLAQGQGAKA